MDAFEILGLNRDADTKQIRVAYRSRIRAVHPDVGGDAETFMQIQSAYEDAVLLRAAMKRRSSRPAQPQSRSQSRSRSRSQSQSQSQPRAQPPAFSRIMLAEIAYRFELGRPRPSPRSFIEAVDVELYPGADHLVLAASALDRITMQIVSKADIATIVAAIVEEIDNARR